jgi:hypothetical protein
MFYYIATLEAGTDADDFRPPPGVVVDRRYPRLGIVHLLSERPLQFGQIQGVLALELQRRYQTAEEE